MVLEIPVKRHVWEFFTSELMYGPKPIEVKRYTPFFGNLCWGYFSKYPLRRWDMTKIEATDISPYVIVLDVQMNVAFEVLDKELMVQVGCFLEDFYNFSIIMYARGRNTIYNNTTGAVERFMEQHNVQSNDVLNLDSTRRMAQRFETKFLYKKKKLANELQTLSE